MLKNFQFGTLATFIDQTIDTIVNGTNNLRSMGIEMTLEERSAVADAVGIGNPDVELPRNGVH